jgi:hypothetical protein
MNTTAKPLFDCGQVVTSPLIAALIESKEVDLQPYLARHVRGDWGQISPESCKQNYDALQKRGYIISPFPLTPSLKLGLCTELDRNETTVILVAELATHGFRADRFLI